jgi:RHS repeat-associated protein
VGLDATYAAQLTGLDLGVNAVGSAVEVTNPAGEKTVTIHDGIGRTVRTLDGLQHATNYAYDIVINGLLETRVTDALNHVTKSRTDGAGRVRESEDQLGKISTFAYDNNGNTKSVRDANGVGHDCVYDARNRRLSCVDTHGDRTELNEFDAHNNLTKTTDALNHETTFSFDARDRKTQSVDRLAGATNFVYDANNNLATLTDAQGSVTSYVFDPRNLLIVETYPDNGARNYVYDAARRLIKRVDQAGAATGYVYDHAGRMVERAYPAGTGNDTFVYDNASRLTSAASAQYNNVVSRVYDAASRILSETLTVGATPYSIGYEYDADNRQTQIIYPNGAVVDRTFTVRNQLESVNYNGVNAAILNYDNAGRLNTKTFGNGLLETRTYQADNLNTSITTPGVTAFGYTWDANKRKLSQTETGIPTNNQVYTYDDEDRLTGFSRNNGDNQSWNLSLVGDWNQFNNNGNMENRTHNAVHELTTVNAVPLVYDVKGNLTGNSNGQVYVWDIENRLTTATDSQNNTLGTYAYDALGRRVSKTVGANTTIFISDGLQKICEYENGTLARSYAYGSYIDEPLVMISGANKYYYHSNNLYSVAALTDAAGAVIERYKYDPYGKATVLAADGVTARTASIVNNPFLYDGYYHDTETGLEFVNARYYSSDLGRFIARDPIGYEGGINLYRYVNNKPTKYIDPSGLECISLVITFDQDWKTWWGGVGSAGENDLTLDILKAGAGWDWDAAMEKLHKMIGNYSPNCWWGNCFRTITIVGHGAAGKAGGFENLGTGLDGDFTKVGTPAFRLLQFIRNHRCTETTFVDLRTCQTADREKGKEFVEAFALRVGIKTKAITDWYAITPHGEEFTSEPGERAVKTGNFPPFEGTKLQSMMRKTNQKLAK